MTVVSASSSRVPAGSSPTARRSAVLAVFFLMGAELFVLPPMLGQVGSSLGTSTSTTALVVTAYVVAYAAFTPAFGAVGERFTRRSMTVTGALVFGVGVLGCSLAPSLGALIGAHAVAGVGGAMASPAIWAYLAETAAPERRARAVAAGAAAYNGGQIVGVPLGALVASLSSWRFALGAVSVGVVGCATWAAATMRSETSPDVGRPLREDVASTFGLWRARVFRTTVAATTLSQAARLGAYTYIGAVFGPRYGLSLVELGLVGCAAGVGSLAGALAAGPLADRWRRAGRSTAVLSAACALLLAAAIAGALTTHEVTIAVPMLVVWFAAGGACYSTGQATLADAVPDRRAAAVSWNNAAMNAGVAVGSAGLGLLAATSTGFWVGAVALALAASAISAQSWAQSWARSRGAGVSR